MDISDLNEIEGQRFPARRLTKNIVGGSSSIQAKNFSLGMVTLDPEGGQMPWHNHPQEEIYMILERIGEICLGSERQKIHAGQTVYIPSNEFHQLANVGDIPLQFIYCYGPAGGCSPLAAGIGGNISQRRRRCASLTGRGVAAVY